MEVLSGVSAEASEPKRCQVTARVVPPRAARAPNFRKSLRVKVFGCSSRCVSEV